MKQRTTQSVTVTLERDLIAAARAAGVNMSQTLAVALDAELKKHAATRWKAENLEGLEALNRFHDEHGYFSDDYRTF
ncbi:MULTISPECIES: type II toxin-antitoxin system CcdA family antitoxin [Enterobacteriaceae]|uniref:Type II toxin-antitoxin system CcdA family antitoxin n=1 Tax=Klebsiella aerogenes TaxID=548 RepID=A0AAP9U611_KLEAE|nr:MULTISPECIES: type II toxin-antitoxin system CcdA family antitoxin [Enterobacteriaceae]ELC6545598.1 type II toxin-antitoxin system CcdA family antitoxin [Enterobacter hormaechei]KLQ84688.1 antitoxin [Enterobacter hormaechei subsp. steigerwaltii]MBD0989802.1 type II toxin-antitoxin system CcdA family antitoxin [Klebsiella michiganensis]MDM3278917.1 type II toxin-antitoxin system CcdA family antitoxin [Citrobacter sp. Ce104]MDM4525279.1 type II toxin-antitoxin system CcdA family antitoxin [Kl